jgi:hypothetical protein
VDLAQLDFPLVAKVIDCPKNQDRDRNDIKKHLIIATSLDLKEIFNTQARHQKVHGSPQKGQKSGLIGQYGALNRQIFSEEKVSIDRFFGNGHGFKIAY